LNKSKGGASELAKSTESEKKKATEKKDEGGNSWLLPLIVGAVAVGYIAFHFIKKK
jgi:hypothetical protein